MTITKRADALVTSGVTPRKADKWKRAIVVTSPKRAKVEKENKKAEREGSFALSMCFFLLLLFTLPGTSCGCEFFPGSKQEPRKQSEQRELENAASCRRTEWN